MTDKPDPKTVRQIAREHIRSGRADVGMTVIKRLGMGLPDEEFFAWEYAVHEAWRDELRTVLWPDEQPQDDGGRDDSFAMVAEGAPAGPARNVANHWNSYAVTINKGCPSPEWAAVAHVTACIIAAMNAETEQPAAEQDGRPLIERLAPEDAERVAALIDERDCWRKEVLELRAKVAELETENTRMREELEQACKLIDELTAAPAPELSTCQDVAMSAKALEQIKAAVQKRMAADAAPQQPERRLCSCGCHPGGDCSACSGWHAGGGSQQPARDTADGGAE